MKEELTEAIRYWEKRRVVYNATLAAVTLTYFVRNYPHSREVLSFDVVLWLIVLAIGANILYCAAYVPDLAAQHSGFRELWYRYRWILLATGIVLGAIITRWFSIAMFGNLG